MINPTSLAKATKKEIYNTLFIFIGIVLVIIGFLYDLIYAGIPYQDPTDELLKNYNFHKSISDTVINIGSIFIIIGIIGAIIIKYKRTIIN